MLQNGRLISLMAALIVVAGLAAMLNLPIAEDPRMTNRFGLVLTPFPGARAERVEALITEKLELKLRELPEIDDISSSSGNGMSSITVALKDEVTEPDLVWSRVRDLIGEVELPAGSRAPQLLDERGYAYTMLIALRPVGSGQAPRQLLQRYGRELQSLLRSLSGTDVVEIDGEVSEEILVNVSSAQAAAAGQTVETIARSLALFDTKSSAGLLENDNTRLQVEITGDLSNVERVARVPLAGRGEGQVLRVADIAEVGRGPRYPDSEKTLHAGVEQIVVAARMLPSVRIASWHRDVSAVLAEFEQMLPGNIEIEIIFDQLTYTNERMGHLSSNIALGFVLILGILLITLGWRSALLVATALPLMMLFTFALMNFAGVPIHQMSVTGLVVALGITVDNAIVMVDDIAQRRRQGINAADAMQQALGHLWLPLLGSTLTTILAFMPIAITPGPSGEFVGTLALVVIFSLIGSYIISHTLVAAVAGRLVIAQETPTLWGSGIQLPALSQWFRGSLALALRYPRRTLALVFVLPTLGFYGITTVPKQFFPPVDRDMFSIELEMPTRTSFAQTEQQVRRLDQLLLQREGIENINWTIGKSAAPYFYNLIETRFGTQNYAQAMIKSDSPERTETVVRELQQELPALFPAARLNIRKLEQGPPVDAPVQIRFYGPDLAVLERLGEEMRLLMSGLPYVTATMASLGESIPTVEISLQEEIITATNYSPQASSRTLSASLDGLLAGALLEGTEEVPVRVRLDAGDRNEPSDLDSINIMLKNPGLNVDYAAAPLAAISEMEIRPSIVSIPHRNGRRVNTVGANLLNGVLADTALTAIRERMLEQDFQVPPGYQMEIGGEAEQRSDSINSMATYVPIIMVMLIVVLVLSFNSWRLCGLILLVAFMSVGLGMLTLTLTGYPFGFQVIIGLLGLMGLAINGAIVILAELRSNPAALKGDSEGIIESVMHCSRHITSTTITTVAGFLPLLLGGGQFWPPFAAAIAGGTVLVTLLSLYFVPAAFVSMTRRLRFEAPLIAT